MGIAIDIDAAPFDKNTVKGLHEGQQARLRLTVQEAVSKEPAKGLHPAVWMERNNPQEKQLSCKERISSYLQSQLAFKPEVDFNSYYVLALNDKASISVIDPINGFGNSKFIARIALNSPGVDWVLSKNHKKLYVATPISHQVVVIDTEIWKVDAFLPFEASPTRLGLQPDGKYLWVGLEATDNKSIASITAVDTEKNMVASSIVTGKGHHEFAFSDDNRTVYASSADDQTIAIIDSENLSLGRTVKSISPPVSLAYSALSKSLYIATENGNLLVIDANKGQSIIDTRSPLKSVRFSADARWGFAVSQAGNKVFIIDASLNYIAQTVAVGSAPDQVSFTDNYAYVRSTKSETVSMLQLDALGKNMAVPITTFPGGQSAPGQSGLLLPDTIMPIPERNAVIVANPADKIIYYYMEGMAAPMGNFENFGLQPMAVMIVDRSMQETSPGVYTGTTRLPSAGQYSVSVLLDNPPVYHCFYAYIEPNPEFVKQGNESVAVKYLMDSKEVTVGSSIPIKLKLSDSGHGYANTDVKDLQLLVFRIPGLWQQRLLAKPLGDNMYQADITPPETGVYQVFAQSSSLKFTFNQQPSLTFRAVKP